MVVSQNIDMTFGALKPSENRKNCGSGRRYCSGFSGAVDAGVELVRAGEIGIVLSVI